MIIFQAMDAQMQTYNQNLHWLSFVKCQVWVYVNCNLQNYVLSILYILKFKYKTGWIVLILRSELSF
jgi:hypothetical protein